MRAPPGPSASSISMISSVLSLSRAASRAIPENSVSTNKTVASPWCNMYPSVAASRRTLLALSTAPSMGTASAHSSASGILGAINATVSPLVTPRCDNAAAKRLQRSATSPQLRLVRPYTTAGNSGCTRSVLASAESGVSGEKLAGVLSSSAPSYRLKVSPFG